MGKEILRAESSHLEDGPGSELQSQFPKAFGALQLIQTKRETHGTETRHQGRAPSQVSSVMPGVLSYPALLSPSPCCCMQSLAICFISTGSLPRDGNPELHNPSRSWLRQPALSGLHTVAMFGHMLTQLSPRGRQGGGHVPHSILRATSLPPEWQGDMTWCEAF